MNKRIKVIIRNLIIGLTLTAVAAISFQLYYGSIYTSNVIIIGLVATVLISKAFLLPFAKIKIEGTVIKSRIKSYRTGEPRGKQSLSYSYRAGVGPFYTSLRVAVVVKTVQGRKFLKRFDYFGEQDDLPVGTKIKFTIFDDKPEIIKK
ncbi:MAG: hypothetical protein E7586_04700 [Ruminococcaceae bacterium]|nr:hypothetical protein [Oscillospiraceae bacterium]